jgi:hypothetical protein
VKPPPRTASALLQRLTQGTESALGDLVEQFQSGKSRWWYWRQVVGVIAHKAFEDLRHSPALVVAVITSAVIVTLITPLVIVTIMTIDQMLFVRGFRWFYVNGYSFRSLLPSVVRNPYWIHSSLYALVGWGVGRIAHRRQAAVVFAFAASLAACGVVSPMIAISVDMTNLSYHLVFHAIPLDAIFHRLGWMVWWMVFSVVILPLVTLIAGLSARLLDSHQSGATA